MKKTFTYGQIPPLADFVKYTRKHFPFPMELVGRDETVMLELLDDPKFNKDGIEVFSPRQYPNKMGVRVQDPRAMLRLIAGLMRIHNDSDVDAPNDVASDLAAAILGHLGYEWI